METPRVIEILAEAIGERVDVWLAHELGVGRRYAQRLIERGGVRINGVRGAKGTRLRAVGKVEIAPFRLPSEGVIPNPELALPELARGRGLVAFDKPAGLPSHPLDYDETETAANAALARLPGLANVGEPLECGLVHRLDTDTSGVLVFATNADAWTAARDALRDRRAVKWYRARVHGEWDAPERTITLALESRGARTVVVESGGREAVTEIRRVRSEGATSLVDVSIVTGVRHQIRATLAHLGYPVVGDRTYGSNEDCERHLLHATSFAIDGFAAQAPLPETLR